MHYKGTRPLETVRLEVKRERGIVTAELVTEIENAGVGRISAGTRGTFDVLTIRSDCLPVQFQRADSDDWTREPQRSS
jgi:hypothetical protein